MSRDRVRASDENRRAHAYLIEAILYLHLHTVKLHHGENTPWREHAEGNGHAQSSKNMVYVQDWSEHNQAVGRLTPHLDDGISAVSHADEVGIVQILLFLGMLCEGRWQSDAHVNAHSRSLSSSQLFTGSACVKEFRWQEFALQKHRGIWSLG